MPYPKTKQENYNLIGGINTKVSRYMNGPQELIRLVNYDFSTPGALTKRPDTSAFLGPSFGTNIQSIFEQTYLNGASYEFIHTFANTYFSGNTTGIAYYGYSTASFGNAIALGGVTFAVVDSLNTSNNYWAGNVGVFTGTLVTKFMRFHATMGYFGNAQMQIVTSPINFGATFVSYGAGAFFTSGLAYRYSLSFLNERGVVGPALPYFLRPAVISQGASQILLKVPSPQLSGFQYKAYNNLAGTTLLMFRDTIGITAALLNQPDTAVTTAIWAIPLFPGNTQIIDDGTSGQTYLLNPQSVGGLFQHDYYRFDTTNLLSPPLIPPASVVGASLGIKNTGEPRFLSMLNNMAVYSGFSMAPSHVFWGELGYPELVQNDSYNELRTDDGDVNTGSIAYNNIVVHGKYRSLHEMSGTSPDNVSFTVTTTQYGFLNNQSQAIFNNQLWFLDGQGKGIGQYNQANTEIISTKVEPYFKRINLDAAKKTAWMIHAKQRNEVWAGIPIDGAVLPNVIIVYDYVANGWTTYEGLSPTAVMVAKGTLNIPTVVMGFSNGDMRYMNATYMGAEFVTTAVRFPFVTNYGWSATQVFRWLFLDVDPVVGVTHSFSSNYYLDAGNSAALSGSIVTAAYQTRTDFGLPGKGLSIELIEGSTLPCRLNGYTVGSRFQRNV